LQEPLRMVSSYMQLLEMDYGEQLDQNAHEYIDFAVDGAHHMHDLINGLLDFSRVGTHGKPFEETSLENVFERVLYILKSSLEESQAQVTHDPLPMVMGDAIQLAQLLQNLIANAIKFRSERPLQIHLAVEKQGTAWQFCLSDNGQGFDSKYAERIFKIFQRLHTREDYPGTGIGLAVCKRIVERHGGQIWAESQPGEGTTFYFSLPKNNRG
jgi:light-regulated signal transduction histidine kinase (bacteriophytochrome)